MKKLTLSGLQHPEGLGFTVDGNLLKNASLKIPLHGISTHEIIRLLAGGASDFAKSVPCDSLHAFLTHSWRGSWWQKVLCVLFYNYYVFTFLFGLAAAVIVAILSWAYDAPYSCLPGGAPEICSKGYSSCYAGSCTLFFTLAFAPTLCPRCCAKTYFFDKGCIDQSSPEAIAKGISSFGGILRRCSTHVVLWTDDIFRRGWCVFELACYEHFGGLNNSQEILLIPAILPTFVVLGNLYIVNAWVVLDGLTRFGIFQWLQAHLGLWLGSYVVALVAVSPFFAGFAYVSYEIGRLRAQLQHELSVFSVEEAGFSLESDRENVENCIRQWYGDLATFNDYVKEKLMPRLTEQIGSRVLVPYPFVLLFAAPTIFHVFDFIAAGDIRGALYPLGYLTGINPLFMIIVQGCLEQQCVPVAVALTFADLILSGLWSAWGNVVMVLPFWESAALLGTLLLAMLFVYCQQSSALHMLGIKSDGAHSHPTSRDYEQIC